MKLTRLQKELTGWLIFFLMCTGAGIYYINHTPNEHPGIIRLHVVANSDTFQDQALKLEVRDEMLRMMEGKENLKEARDYLQANLKRIERRAEKVVAEYGEDYPVRAELKVTYIPEKSYEDLTLPAGNYEALKITLGRGGGQNWWCVIFPQLCLVGEENGSGKIMLKSKVKELLKAEENPEEKAYREEKGGESAPKHMKNRDKEGMTYHKEGIFHRKKHCLEKKGRR